MRFRDLTLWVSLVVSTTAGPTPDLRTIEFETSEVTEPDVALSPDAQWLIFTMLGHLFRLPVSGGEAEQLTFGPYYDSQPAISQDAKHVAFISDRDGSGGNVFVLEFATGGVRQVTHEFRARQPSWTPDGKALVYQRLTEIAGGWSVHRIDLSTREPETLIASGASLGSVFYLPDGRLAWTTTQSGTGSPRITTRVQVGANGKASTLRAIGGDAGPVVPSPAGDGLYCVESERLVFVPLPEGELRTILSVQSDNWGWPPTFAVAPDNKTLYVGPGGRLRKVPLDEASPDIIPFTARVQLEGQEPVQPVKVVVSSGSTAALPRAIVSPRLSPDGGLLVFGAARFLWKQSLDGRPAERLLEGDAFEGYPAFSPDGGRLAFVRNEKGENEIRILDLVL